MKELFQFLKIYNVYVMLWQKTIGRYRERHFFEWKKRFSSKLLRRTVCENGQIIKTESGEKKIVFIGYNKLSIMLEEYLNNCTIYNINYYVDEDEHSFDDEKFVPFDNILYEDIDKIYVVVTTRNNIFKKISKLLDYGFELSNMHIIDIDKERGTKGKECYDVLLGYTREDDYNGFTIFGDRNSKFKIVTLGGSTTDATCSGLKSWSELLYSRIKGISNNEFSVWCGGMGSFSSSNELLKFIRDVMILQPTIVISYSGFNDIYLEYIKYFSKNDYFACGYQMNFLIKALEKGIINSYNPKIGVQKIISGDNSKNSIENHWIENERMMYAICKEKGIRFLSYFQPCRLYEEKSDTEIHHFFVEKYARIKSMIKEENNSFIQDLSELFSGETNIYTDECHVYEKGNRKICDRIYRDIRNYIKTIGEYK